MAFRPAAGSAEGIVHAVLLRRSCFARARRDLARRTPQAAEQQVLAANVDVAFLVAGLVGDLNLRRLERYLATAWESGSEPVVVLTKRDLVADLDHVQLHSGDGETARRVAAAPGSPPTEDSSVRSRITGQ